MTNFQDLGVSAPILKALDAEGYATPTPIQVQAIPIVLKGRDPNKDHYGRLAVDAASNPTYTARTSGSRLPPSTPAALGAACTIT